MALKYLWLLEVLRAFLQKFLTGSLIQTNCCTSFGGCLRITQFFLLMSMIENFVLLVGLSKDYNKGMFLFYLLHYLVSNIDPLDKQ